MKPFIRAALRRLTPHMSGPAVGGCINRAEVGRCGTQEPQLIPASDIRSAFCILPAGHAGWHRSDDGCEWGAVSASREGPPTPLAHRRRVHPARLATILLSLAAIAVALAGVAVSIAHRDWSAIGWQLTTIGGFTVALIVMGR